MHVNGKIQEFYFQGIDMHLKLLDCPFLLSREFEIFVKNLRYFPGFSLELVFTLAMP